MVLGKPVGYCAALVQHRVVDGGGEEGVPVLALSLHVVQPVAYVGEHAVDVDDGQRHGLVGHGSSGAAQGRAVAGLGDVHLRRHPRAQVADVTDEADGPATAAQLVENVHHLVEGIGIE